MKMQQRPTSRLTQSLDDERSPPRTTDIQDSDHRLPLYHRRNVRRDGESSQSRWIHVIPLIVLLCIFILWWFSYPVKVVMNEGNIVEIRSIEIPLLLNESNHVELAILATATAVSPIASLPVNLSTYFEPANLTTYFDVQSQPMVSTEIEETDHVPIAAATD